MKPGTEYEIFVKEIYEKLLKYEKVDNVEVKHNIKLVGTTGEKHQIDLYWEFIQAKIKHKIIIECKDYDSFVPKNKIMEFHDKILDIGGVKGVYVTKTGYQSGAKEIADKYGITLIEMRKPNDKDWEGRVKKINIDLQYYFPRVYDFLICVDKDWLDKLDKDKRMTIEGIANKYNIESTYIIDEEKKYKKSIKDIINELPYKNNQDENEYAISCENLYILVQEIDMKIRIKSLKFKYKYNILNREINIDGEKSIKAIIKDAITGDVNTIPYTN